MRKQMNLFVTVLMASALVVGCGKKDKDGDKGNKKGDGTEQDGNKK